MGGWRVEEGSKRRIVERSATNAQTVQFVADRATEIASAADELAAERPEFSTVAALEREHRHTLMEMAQEERRLTTAVQFEENPPPELAAVLREHRKDLLEIAREEGRIAEQLEALVTDDHPEIGAMAEQAHRNRQLLREIAAKEQRSHQALWGTDDSAGPNPS